MNSKSVFLAMAVVLYAGILIDHYFTSSQIPKNRNHQKQLLKSCLFSGNKKREKEQKRVQFADDVKDISSIGSANAGKLSRKKHRTSTEIQRSSCRNEIIEFNKMPANRAALYSGILKDRLQRLEYSF